jgi:nucleotide-binding universal stress UspA family protein
MIAIRTVLCPVDFSPATPRQIDLAAEVCRAFGARLVLHHNRHSLGTGASVAWMWNADRHPDSAPVVEAKLSDCLSRVPNGIPAEPLMTEGPVTRAVLAAAELVDADLIVLTAHGTMADDHASVTRHVLEYAGRAALVLHEPKIEARTPRFAASAGDPQIVVAPTDLEPASRAALDLAFDLTRQLPPIELHLLHVLPGARARRQAGSDQDAPGRLGALVPRELAGRVKVHVERGDVGHVIAAAAERLSASCIVMGEQTRASFRWWFGGDAPRVVLHEAHCPVWYVPGRRAA